MERVRLAERLLDLVVASESRGRLLFVVLMLLDRPRLALLHGSVCALLLALVGVLASNLVKSSVSVWLELVSTSRQMPTRL